MLIKYKEALMQGILGIIVLVVNIIVTVQIVKSALGGGQKALWIILIWILPIIGLILYFLLGKKKAV